jgi:hypothetical protein
MNSTELCVTRPFKQTRQVCSPAYLSARLSDGPITFAKIADLAEKCDLWEVGNISTKSPAPPITFTIPAAQQFASVSRVIE